MKVKVLVQKSVHTSSPATVSFPPLQPIHHYNFTNMRSFGTEISGNRRPNQELSSEQRSILLEKVNAGEKKTEIAKDLRISRRVIYNTISRWKTHKTTHSLSRSGRPMLLNARERRRLVFLARSSPKNTYQSLKNDLDIPSLSRSTLYRSLRKSNLKNWKMRRRAILTKEHAKKRRIWCLKWKNFKWKKAYFSDECSLERGTGNDIIWVFRYTAEAYKPEFIEGISKGKDLSQMIWACASFKQKSRVVCIERDNKSPRNGYSAKSYKKALRNGLIPIYRRSMKYFQDQAPIHMAKETKDFFKERRINWEIFPPHSPDLNIIEHLWWKLKKIVYKDYPELRTMGKSEEDLKALCTAIKKSWRKIPQKFIRNLINSMERRIKAVQKAKGWYTKY